MHQAYLKAVQRVARGQHFETAEVRRQDERALAWVPWMQLVPDVEPIVGNAARKAAVEESAQPNVLSARPAKIYVRRAQDALSLGGALFGECDLEIADSDFPVTAVEAMKDQTARDSQFVQDEVGQQAERMQETNEHPENDPILYAQL